MANQETEVSAPSFEVAIATSEHVVQVPEVLASAPETVTTVEGTAITNAAAIELQPDSITPSPDSQDDQAASGLRFITLRRVAAGAAITGFALTGGAASAEAAPADTQIAQGQTQESDWTTKGALILSGLSIVAATAVTVRGNRNQAREKTLDRFAATIKEVKGESSGQAQVMQLHALTPYAESNEFAPKVTKTTVAYLRARRSELDGLREQFDEKSDEFEAGVRNTRNAAREALDIFLLALPKTREQLVKQTRVAWIRRLVGQKSGMERLSELTDTYVEDETRVNARAINLDFIRDIKFADFQSTDLTGAGLQGNQIANVIFRDARLSEAQFEGSRLFQCDLREADFRAAYLYGATIENCVINKDTKFGNLPDNHPDARLGSLHPKNPDEYRGETSVVLKDLISDKLSEKEIIQLVHEWQRNGLRLKNGSNLEYFLNPELPAN